MGVEPMSVEAESKFISALIPYLNTNMCQSNDTLPDLTHGSELHAVSSILILVGRIHATKLPEIAQGSLPSFTRRDWQAGQTALEVMALEIKENINSFPANLMVVLQLFDNVAFHTITKEELPSHAGRTSMKNMM
jgi:hypothetical protein